MPKLEEQKRYFEDRIDELNHSMHMVHHVSRSISSVFFYTLKKLPGLIIKQKLIVNLGLSLEYWNAKKSAEQSSHEYFSEEFKKIRDIDHEIETMAQELRDLEKEKEIIDESLFNHLRHQKEFLPKLRWTKRSSGKDQEPKLRSQIEECAKLVQIKEKDIKKKNSEIKDKIVERIKEVHSIQRPKCRVGDSRVRDNDLKKKSEEEICLKVLKPLFAYKNKSYDDPSYNYSLYLKPGNKEALYKDMNFKNSCSKNFIRYNDKFITMIIESENMINIVSIMHEITNQSIEECRAKYHDQKSSPLLIHGLVEYEQKKYPAIRYYAERMIFYQNHFLFNMTSSRRILLDMQRTLRNLEEFKTKNLTTIKRSPHRQELLFNKSEAFCYIANLMITNLIIVSQLEYFLFLYIRDHNTPPEYIKMLFSASKTLLKKFEENTSEKLIRILQLSPWDDVSRINEELFNEFKDIVNNFISTVKGMKELSRLGLDIERFDIEQSENCSFLDICEFCLSLNSFSEALIIKLCPSSVSIYTYYGIVEEKIRPTMKKLDEYLSSLIENENEEPTKLSLNTEQEQTLVSWLNEMEEPTKLSGLNNYSRYATPTATKENNEALLVATTLETSEYSVSNIGMTTNNRQSIRK